MVSPNQVFKRHCVIWASGEGPKFTPNLVFFGRLYYFLINSAPAVLRKLKFAIYERRDMLLCGSAVAGMIWKPVFPV